MNHYLPRLIENTIEQQLDIMGAIVIEGPKWVGKSTTGGRYARTIIKLQDPIIYRKYQIYASSDRNLLLSGEKPLMFDEWQKIPDLWDFIRLDVDESNGKGMYILTGSAKPIKDPNRHSGTGRMVKIKMRPMSLFEQGVSNGQVSLQDLFNHHPISIHPSTLTIPKLAELICRGGWPGSFNLSTTQALMAMENYYTTLTSEDIVDIDNVKRDPTRVKTVIKSFARNISTMTSYQTMVNDIKAHGDFISDEAFYAYIRALEKLYIIDNIPAWNPKLRSKSTIRTTDKRQLIDPSLAAVALNAKPHDLVHDMETFGFLFESLCARDLSVYIESLGGTLSHYRDSDDLEVDLIVHLPDGRWGAIEVKVGLNELDKATSNLLKLKNKVDVQKEPSFLMILTGSDLAYQLAEEVYVVPLGCLKP